MEEMALALAAENICVDSLFGGLDLCQWEP